MCFFLPGSHGKSSWEPTVYHGVPGGPLVHPTGNRGTSVPRESTMSRAMLFFPVGSREYPRDPTGKKKKKKGEIASISSTGIPTGIPTAAQGLAYLSSRKPTSNDGIIIPQDVPRGPMGSHGTRHGNSRGTPRYATGSRGMPGITHGIPWVPVGRPTGSRGVQWVLMGSRGFPREISGSHGKEHNNVNHCRVGNSAS